MTDHDPQIVIDLMNLVLDVLEAQGPMHDADLAKAVTALVSVWGFHSGQICTAPTRAIVHRSVYDKLVSGLQAAAPNLVVGPPEAEDTVVGPVISAQHRDRVEQFIETGRREGGGAGPQAEGTRGEGRQPCRAGEGAEGEAGRAEDRPRRGRDDGGHHEP